MYGPSFPHKGGPTTGVDIVSVKRATSRAFPDVFPWADFDPIWNQRISKAWMTIQADQLREVDITGNYGKRSHEFLREQPRYGHPGQWAFDATSVALMEGWTNAHKTSPRPAVPNLGPIMAGGISVLLHDLTHETDGIPLYPAFDDAFRLGARIVAPENLTVQRSSSSNPGQAFYAIGGSAIQFWFAHLDRTHLPGERFRKGQLVGRVAPNHVGGGPHCHVGINVEFLWGHGKQLIHHKNYTHGAPTVGAQLAAKSV
jgi:hypothetical protein